MDAAVAHVASAVAMLVHTTLVPAGCGAVAALVVMSRRTPSAARSSLTPSASDRAAALRAVAADHQLAVVRPALPAAPAGSSRPVLTTRTVTWQLAAVCTVASGVVHAVATPHHATEHVAFGVFFFLCTFGQFGWATMALTSPTPSLLWSGLGLNVLLIGLWVVTRTVGLPLGLTSGPEGIGAWDVAATVWELGALACCVRLLLTGSRPALVPARSGVWVVRAAVAASGVAVLAVAWSGAPR
jgi:hypothetical protein